MASNIVETTEPCGPAAPICSSVDQYPTGPILIFPPPAPVLHRHSLRSRRGVVMQVQIPRNPLQLSTTSPWSAKGHIQPHRNHLPRRRNPKRFVITHDLDTPEEVRVSPVLQHIDSPLALDQLALSPIDESIYQPNPPVDESHLQEILDGLWIAFANGTERLDELPKQDGCDAPYTHIVSISYGDGDGAAEEVYDGHTQRLRLVLPGNARVERPRTGLGLTDRQLRAARDFLAQALPASLISVQGQQAVRVLITTPFKRQTDAMCVVSCYLALTCKKDVEDVLKAVDEDDSVLSVWKSEVSGNEVEQVQKIAKAWSWTQVIQPGFN